MLLLARKVGESLMIDGNIRITVDRVGKRVVRLRIDAPLQVPVDREEVWYRRVAEQMGSGHSDGEGPA